MTTVIVSERVIRLDETDRDLTALAWFINSAGYALAGGASEYGLRKMHRVIMERIVARPLGRHEMVDHINGDRLDNRRANLRILTNHENGHNRADLNANNTTGYRGVYRVTRSTNYMAVITVNKRRQYLGVYPTPEAAAAAYDQAAAQLVGHVNRGNRR